MISPVKIWRNQKKIASLIGKVGKIVSWTIIRVPPADFSSYAPYPVILVEFPDTTRMSVQLVDWKESDLASGTSVILVVRKVFETGDGIIPYGIKAKPL